MDTSPDNWTQQTIRLLALAGLRAGERYAGRAAHFFGSSKDAEGRNIWIELEFIVESLRINGLPSGHGEDLTLNLMLYAVGSSDNTMVFCFAPDNRGWEARIAKKTYNGQLTLLP